MYILYSILLYLSPCHSDVARPYIYIFLIPFLYLDLCVLDICCEIVRLLTYLLDIAALSETRRTSIRYTHNNNC